MKIHMKTLFRAAVGRNEFKIETNILLDFLDIINNFNS